MGKFPERNDLCAADLRDRGEEKIIEKEETPSERVKRELLGWLGVTVHDHRFGGIEFRVNGREMGHMHGDELAVSSSILGDRSYFDLTNRLI
jgi:hypothetical protein